MTEKHTDYLAPSQAERRSKHLSEMIEEIKSYEASGASDGIGLARLGPNGTDDGAAVKFIGAELSAQELGMMAHTLINTAIDQINQPTARRTLGLKATLASLELALNFGTQGGED